MTNKPKTLDSADTTTDFVIGTDDFEDLEFNPALQHNLRHIFNRAKDKPVRQFVLLEKARVRYVCRVTLIEKGDKFTPRLAFSVRDKAGAVVNIPIVPGADTVNVKANIDLEECHDYFWKLVSFLKSLKDVDIPEGKKLRLSAQKSEIITTLLRDSDPASLKDILLQLSKNVTLSVGDVNLLLNRRQQLTDFLAALESERNERFWQDFLEQNKWIFGYGLNYQILRQQQPQPSYAGASIHGRGAQKGDFLCSTEGDISFTVLVEIKTPQTNLLQGREEIRSGAWSLSKELTDSLSQIQANIYSWDKRGSSEPGNRDLLEKQNIYTVCPKGIIVIGSLSNIKDQRNKWETFERLRRSVHGVDIITFDELYNRARFIVDRSD